MTDQVAHDQKNDSGPRSADDQRNPGTKARAALLYPDWRYIEQPALEDYRAAANHWMLVRHAIFQQRHFNEYPDPVDQNACERWRGHPHFEWTGHFVEKYDQNAIQIDYDNAPIEVFEPMVHRLFAREPRRIAID